MIPTRDAAPPLFLSGDPTLVADLLRLAAAAGVTPEVRKETAGLLREWSTAPVVLVGADLAEAVAEAGPPRREGVHLLARDEAPDALFRVALGIGAEDVATLPRSDAWLVELLTDIGESGREPALTVAVIGGSGGAGATTFGCALAGLAARAGPTLLIDTDRCGPGVDRVLGFDGLPGVRWDALQQTTGRLSARSLREAVPSRDGLGVLTWPDGPAPPLPVFAVREVLSAARRGHETVVVDLPRAPDPVTEEVLGRCDRVVVVAAASVTGAAATARVCQRVRELPAMLVVRGAGVDAEGIGRVTGVPVVATMRDQRGLAEAVDLGAGPLHARRGVLARTARDVLEQLRAPA